MSIFAQRLKELRKDKRLTQKELGKSLFIDDTSISKYENEKAMPENELLQRIADYFEVSIDYLLGRSDEKKSILKNKNEENYNTFIEIECDNENLKLNKEDIEELFKKLKNIGFDIKKLL